MRHGIPTLVRTSNIFAWTLVISEILIPGTVFAQGCILTRNMSPVLGAQLSPYLQKGEWQIGASYRQFTADTQYQRTALSEPVTGLRTNVISKMRYAEYSGTYAVTPQWNLSVTVPLVILATSNRALPSTIAGSTRFTQSTTGFGDITIGARHWFRDCGSNPDRNISLGFAVKTPSGNSNAQDLFPNAQGLDLRQRVVDQSIQLGDGGWGFLISTEAFRQVGKLTLFGSAVYLFNPRTRNDSLSPRAMLAPAGPAAIDPKERYNTVSDSYLVRGGAGLPLPRLKATALSVAGRVEGVPVNDILGATNGFRRPGYYLTIEPGINYTNGKTTMALSVPLRVHQNVKDSLGIRRDSTFADHMLLMSVTYRFGGKRAVETPAQP
jgi:hypothetical protein